MCFDIVVICFAFANGQISSVFDRGLCPPHDSGGVLSFNVFIFPIERYLAFHAKKLKTISMKCQNLFSRKNNKHISIYYLLVILLGVLPV